MTGSAPPAVEPAWERLRAQLALQDGFWLGFLFCSNLFVVNELRARTRDYARSQLKNTESIDVDHPDALMSVMPWLLEDHPADLAVSWLVGVSGEPGPWSPAWARFLRRLNERRDLLRQLVPGGVVLVCPPGVLATARESAPDLWSYRSMVVTVEEPASHVHRRHEEPVAETTRAHLPSSVTDADVRWAVEHALEPGVEPSVELRPFLRESTAAGQAAHTADAVTAARRGLEVAATPEDEALAHAWLARAMAGRGDLPSALDHAGRALAARRPLGFGLTGDLLAILVHSPTPEQSLTAAEAQLDIARADAALRGGSLASLRYLLRSLLLVANLHVSEGRLQQARAQADEALALASDIGRRYGESPDFLQDLITALNTAGSFSKASGDLDQAGEHFDEALSTARRVAEQYGGTADLTLELSAALGRIGDLNLRRGRLDEAYSLFTEALELQRGDAERSDERGVSLQRIAMHLNQIGSVEKLRGQLDNARTSLEEALALARTFFEIHGEDTQLFESTSGVLILLDSLVELGELHVMRDEFDEARPHYAEALSLAERLHSHYGETPRTLPILIHALRGVGYVDESQGRFDEAASAYSRALSGFTRLRDRYGAPWADDRTREDLQAAVERVRRRLE